jgi:hypothetical protein
MVIQIFKKNAIIARLRELMMKQEITGNITEKERLMLQTTEL